MNPENEIFDTTDLWILARNIENSINELLNLLGHNPLAEKEEDMSECNHGVKISIVEVLKDLRFGRPAWCQKMLTRFIKEAEQESFKYEGDGTFNHMVNDVFNKGNIE